MKRIVCLIVLFAIVSPCFAIEFNDVFKEERNVYVKGIFPAPLLDDSWSIEGQLTYDLDNDNSVTGLDDVVTHTGISVGIVKDFR